MAAVISATEWPIDATGAVRCSGLLTVSGRKGYDEHKGIEQIDAGRSDVW